MEKAVAKSFNQQVDHYVKDEEDKEKLYSALAKYQQSRDVRGLMRDLRELLNEPGRLHLYDGIKSLIPVKHQMEYDRLAPVQPQQRLRVVHLKRRVNEGLGFSVRGGLEHGVGVYVSHVAKDSQAQNKGLVVGDEIVRVNGYTIKQAIHDEVLSLIKSKRHLVLKVRYVGLIPVKDCSDDKLSWKRVNSNATLDHVLDNVSGVPRSPGEGEGHRKVNLRFNLPTGGGLGCSICSGPTWLPGIFIQSVRPGGLAEEAGLETGDRIVSVNQRSFRDVTHAEAVVALKSSRQLDVRVSKHEGVDLFRPSRPSSVHQINMDDYDGVKDAQEEVRNPGLNTILKQRKKATDVGNVNVAVVRQEDIVQQALEALQRREAAHPGGENNKVTRAPPTPAPSSVVDDMLIAPPPGFDGSALDDSTPMPSSGEVTLTTTPPGGNRTDTDSATVSNRQTTVSGSEMFTPTPSSSGSATLTPAPSSGESNGGSFTAAASALLQSRAEKLRQVHGSEGDIDTFTPNRLSDRPSAPPPPPPITGPARSPAYMSNSPAFRIQKPVLLSPIQGKVDQGPTSAPVVEGELTDDNFNPYRLFTNEEIAGRKITLMDIPKGRCSDLGVILGVEGNRIIVGEIYAGGALHKHGGVHMGDQLMMVNGKSLIGVSLSTAQQLIAVEYSLYKSYIQLVVASAPSHRFEEEILPRPDYDDIPSSNVDDIYDEILSPTVYKGDVPVTII